MSKSYPIHVPCRARVAVALWFNLFDQNTSGGVEKQKRLVRHCTVCARRLHHSLAATYMVFHLSRYISAIPNLGKKRQKERSPVVLQVPFRAALPKIPARFPMFGLHGANDPELSLQNSRKMSLPSFKFGIAAPTIRRLIFPSPMK